MAVAAVAVEAAAAEVVAGMEAVVALRVSVAALQASVAALLVSVAALRVSVALADAHLVYTADALSSDAASVAVAAVAAEAGAAELAGYGRPAGAGSTPAGARPHHRLRSLLSRLSQSPRSRRLRKRSDESHSILLGL